MSWARTFCTSTLLLFSTLHGGFAHAYTFATASKTGAPAHWEAQFIPLAVSAATVSVTLDDALVSTRAAVAAWDERPCHGLLFTPIGATNANTAAIDGENRLVWSPEVWIGSPAELALTRVTRNSTTGEIVDADILINERDFDFAVEAMNPLLIDLPGVVTHEVGHLLGLDHSTVQSATMTPAVPENVGLLATLDQDDAWGICHLYEPGPPPQNEGTTPQPLQSWRISNEHRKIYFSDSAVAWVIFGLLGLFFLTQLGRQRPAPHSVMPAGAVTLVIFGLVHCDSSDAQDDLATAEDTANGDSLPTDGQGEDQDQEGQDQGEDVPETSGEDVGDRGAPLDEPLAALLARAPRWRVVSVSSRDLNDEGDSFPHRYRADPTDGGALELVFAPTGEVAWLRDGTRVKGCAARGAWEALSDDTLQWVWTHPAQACGGQWHPRTEILHAGVAPEGGALVLELVDAPWTIAESGRVPRPFALHLQPTSVLLPAACEGPPPEPTECILTCSPAEDASAPWPVAWDWTCGPTGESAPCTSLTPAADGSPRFRCTSGCTIVECQAGPAGGCTALASGQSCAW